VMNAKRADDAKRDDAKRAASLPDVTAQFASRARAREENLHTELKHYEQRLVTCHEAIKSVRIAYGVRRWCLLRGTL
jgi:primosomal protein N''